ncbi:hypothetical protein GIB67_042361 [Kingdonia uniflora]|uniref:Major facilitator superfamily (MFS) profile domain-containing protein n=1 Tax=Kingdonia uniflora TaxID=39325 RepID=A0A7J7LUR3_9MAGN|nr:hypothetical protein GIB67_042361 [Kingdonia uniflora]
MGRKRVYGMNLMIMVICSVASRLSFGKSAKSVIATLCFFRFWFEFGIGGDYPLSATIMSEYANKKTRGAFIAAVFAMQGFRILAGGMVGIILSAAFKAKFDAPSYEVDPIGPTVSQADYVWRLIVMFGALPAALTYYWRLKIPETARYISLVAKNAKQAAADMSKVLYFSTVGWIPAAKTMNAVEEVYKIARAQTLIALSVAGKAGAIIGAFGFLYAAQSQDKTKIDVGYHVGIGVKNSLIMLGVINFFGMLFTLLVPESNGRSLELRIEVKNAAQSQDKTKTDAGYHAGIGVKNSLIMFGVNNFFGMLFALLVSESNEKSLEDISCENEEDKKMGSTNN